MQHSPHVGRKPGCREPVSSRAPGKFRLERFQQKVAQMEQASGVGNQHNGVRGQPQLGAHGVDHVRHFLRALRKQCPCGVSSGTRCFGNDLRELSELAALTRTAVALDRHPFLARGVTCPRPTSLASQQCELPDVLARCDHQRTQRKHAGLADGTFELGEFRKFVTRFLVERRLVDAALAHQ